MYAVITYRQVPAAKIDEAVRTYREITGPNRKAQKGFKEGLILTNRDNDKLIAISFWESEADYRAAGSAQQYVDAVTGELSTREFFEVGIRDPVAAADTEVNCARVAHRQAQPGKLEEVLRIYRDMVIPDRRTQEGYQGGYVLVDKSSGKLVTLGLWETETELEVSRHPNEVGNLTVGPPVRENYEVSAQV